MELLAPLSNTRLEDSPLLAVCNCLLSIFAATIHTEGRSSIRNLRTRHALVTGTHLSRLVGFGHFGPTEHSQTLFLCVERNLLLRENGHICVLQIFQKTVLKNFLQVIGNHPRRTPTSQLHYIINIEPISIIIHRLTAKFFAHYTSHPNPLVQQIGNYTQAYLTIMYRKYKHNDRSIYCYN